MLLLYIEAPFAAFRTFTAGWYRPTVTFLTPSAAYGLILNLAAIESRLREDENDHDGQTPATLTRTGLPEVDIAIGSAGFRLRGKRMEPLPEEARFPKEATFPRVQSNYLQLHTYPVGATGQERAESTKGNKYNITPVRREFLTDLRAVVALRNNPDLEDRVRRGVAGEWNATRYGLPFLGDNAFLLDLAEILDGPAAAYWYEAIRSQPESGPRYGTTRLTIRIDRGEMTKTTSELFAPTEEATTDIPDAAWVQLRPASPEPVVVSVKKAPKSAGG